MITRPQQIIVALLLTALLVTTMGCSTVGSSRKEEPTPTPIPPPPIPDKPTYTVKRGSVIDSLSFTGRVSPIREEEMFFKLNGRVKKVYFERNDLVKQGDLLAELENDDLLRQLAQTQLELDTAQLNLQKALDSKQYTLDKANITLQIRKLQLAQMEAADYETDVTVARANLQKAEATLKQAQARYDARAARPGAEASSEALELERTTLDYEIALANYNRTVARQQSAKFDIEIQRLQVALAQLEVDNITKEVDAQLTNAVDRAKLSVERLQAQVDNTRIYSPIDGKVTSVSAYEGRDVVAYRPVFVVADESGLKVTAEPMSTQLQRLAEGMSASIILSAYPGKELPAKIERLPYPYGGGGGVSAATEGTDKRVHIDFDPDDLKLTPGDLVRIIVVLEQKDDALWLPPAAIRTFSGRKFVEVEEEGRRRRVDVIVGIESADRVEIVEGLQEGQIVVGP